MAEEDPAVTSAQAAEQNADNQAMAQLNELRLEQMRAAGQGGQSGGGSTETRIQNAYEKDWGYGNPDKDASNKYQNHFNRDHVLAKIPKEKLEFFIEILKSYDSLIMDFVSFNSPVGDEMARLFAGEKLSILDSLRAGDGFERTMQVTLRSELAKSGGTRPVMPA